MIKALWPPISLFLVTLALTLTVTYWFAPLVVLFAVDSYARSKDYAYLKSKPQEYFTPKVYRRYAGSWCGRTVVKALDARAVEYYQTSGYRFYHVFPDRIFTKDSPLFKKAFWKSILIGHKR